MKARRYDHLTGCRRPPPHQTHRLRSSSRVAAVFLEVAIDEEAFAIRACTDEPSTPLFQKSCGACRSGGRNAPQNSWDLCPPTHLKRPPALLNCRPGMYLGSCRYPNFLPYSRLGTSLPLEAFAPRLYGHLVSTPSLSCPFFYFRVPAVHSTKSRNIPFTGSVMIGTHLLIMNA